MAWEYAFESAETLREAKDILNRRDADGWVAVGLCRGRGTFDIWLRRLRRTADRPANPFENSLDEEYGD